MLPRSVKLVLLLVRTLVLLRVRTSALRPGFESTWLSAANHRVGSRFAQAARRMVAAPPMDSMANSKRPYSATNN
jgi:hypothetical protein